MNDLNEFILKSFQEGQVSDSDEETTRRRPSVNPEVNLDVDAFDYIDQDALPKKKKKLSAKNGLMME